MLPTLNYFLHFLSAVELFYVIRTEPPINTLIFSVFCLLFRKFSISELSTDVWITKSVPNLGPKGQFQSKISVYSRHICPELNKYSWETCKMIVCSMLQCFQRTS
jgi:hypothetical protein